MELQGLRAHLAKATSASLMHLSTYWGEKMPSHPNDLNPQSSLLCHPASSTLKTGPVSKPSCSPGTQVWHSKFIELNCPSGLLWSWTGSFPKYAFSLFIYLFSTHPLQICFLLWKWKEKMFQQILSLVTFSKKGIHPEYHLLSASHSSRYRGRTGEMTVPTLTELRMDDGRGWALVELRRRFLEEEPPRSPSCSLVPL